jgi:hypothetical protein
MIDRGPLAVTITVAWTAEIDTARCSCEIPRGNVVRTTGLVAPLLASQLLRDPSLTRSGSRTYTLAKETF